jgi:glycosyltransferase involved in cell wall biosynthesis
MTGDDMRGHANARPRVGFVIEESLGHATHAANLQRLLDGTTSIEAELRTVAQRPTRVPGLGNWTVQAGLQARSRVRELRRAGRLDALFVHTQVPAILIPDVIRRTPTVVSLDATPKQYDELGQHYAHRPGPAVVERLKTAIHRSCFHGARRLVAWSDWTKAGLVDDYGVPAGKVSVIPPGIDTDFWDGGPARPDRESRAGPARVLFVGGNFARKGGLVLLDAATQLRDRGVEVEFDIVTRDDVPAAPDVRVHHGLTPNAPELIDLYRRADVFCLPTLADCLPLAFAEAGAMSLPCIATDVGAVREIVEHERTGLVVPVDDADQLARAIERLADDPASRRRLGDAARRHILAAHDARRNAERLVELLIATATDAAAPTTRG